ncbi:MAG: flavin monoamine oxidase family protein [Candidatus Latescibacterota bacterium]
MHDSIIHLDTAIVGGGIVGLYSALMLRQAKGPHHRMALFESSSRFGGRIETQEMDGFLAEYGPMRFERMAQPLLMGLIAELGLETSYFHPYMSATDPESLYYPTEEDAGMYPGKAWERAFTTLELLALGILRILQKSGGDLNDPGDPRHWDWWAGLDESFYHQVRTEITLRGKPLYRIGFWNALSEVLSHRAVNKIIQYGTFYHVIHYNPSAAEWMIFWLRGLHPKESLVGIKQGSEALVTESVRRLSSFQPGAVTLYQNHCLTAIHPADDSRLLLELSAPAGETVRALARNVILALPRCPLLKLATFLPGYIGGLIDSVIPIPLAKTFFVTKAPWWDGNTKPQIRASSVPTRELHYYYREDNGEKRGMVMVYGESPSLNFWKVFVRNEPHLQAELNNDNRLLECYLKYLSANPHSEDPAERKAQRDAITCFGIRDWSREPFEAGCHNWKPGIKVEEAIDALTGFSLTGGSSERQNVHICGEAYSDFQGFIEGGLRNALLAIGKIG